MKTNKLLTLFLIPLLLTGCKNEEKSDSGESSSIEERFEIIDFEAPTDFTHNIELGLFTFKKGENITKINIGIPNESNILNRGYTFCWVKNTVTEQKIFEIDGCDQKAVFAADFLPTKEYVLDSFERYQGNTVSDAIKNEICDCIVEYFKNPANRYTKTIDYDGLYYGDFTIANYKFSEDKSKTFVEIGQVNGKIYSNQDYCFRPCADDDYGRYELLHDDQIQFKVNGENVDYIDSNTIGKITYEGIYNSSYETKNYIAVTRYLATDYTANIDMPKVGQKLKFLTAGMNDSRMYIKATMYKVGNNPYYTYINDPDEDPNITLTQEMVNQGIMVEFCMANMLSTDIPLVTENNEVLPAIKMTVNGYQMFKETKVVAGKRYCYYYAPYSGLIPQD